MKGGGCDCRRKEEKRRRRERGSDTVKESCEEVSNGGMYELSHELIFSSLLPINSEGFPDQRAGSRNVILGGLPGAHSMLLCAERAGREGCVFGGSAVVLVRAPRAPRDLTEWARIVLLAEPRKSVSCVWLIWSDVTGG
ncbi:hypothetical protein Acr_29g0008280 [Actinidia rufa]|uniref:Uncharacterized protein n=1 Tax=Actinidia rufa TaxID=165716 RepID=A0A7J0HEW6_9ERIC|nr:hypothetical protein Acr_29g0008280 [Actinidia rufa]